MYSADNFPYTSQRLQYILKVNSTPVSSSASLRQDYNVYDAPVHNG